MTRDRPSLAFGSVIALMVAFLLLGFGGAPAHAALPQLTGTFYADDNDVYYLQQIGNQVWWVGESVDKDANPNGGFLGPNHVWSHGLESTSVFRGTISGNTLTGKWVEVTRGISLGTGTITLAIDTVTDFSGTHAHLVLTGGTFRAHEWTQGDPVNDFVYQFPDGQTTTMNFYQRFQAAKKSIPASNDFFFGDKLGDTNNPENLRPYRDQTVIYGHLTSRKPFNDEFPHVNLPPTSQRDYETFACNANDGDLDIRIRADINRLPTDFPRTTLPVSDPGLGWGNSNAADEGEDGFDHRDILHKLLNIGLFDPTAAAAENVALPGNNFYIGAEGVMYAGTADRTPNFDCASSAPQVFPGWAADGGNSILVNSRPIEGRTLPQNVQQGTNPCLPVKSDEMTLDSLNGLPLLVGCGFPTDVRVTGALILDCGHSDADDLDTAYFTPTHALHNCDQDKGWERDLVCDFTTSPPTCTLDNGEGDEGDDQNQEIHPIYSLDLIECPLGDYPDDACPGKHVRGNLTGAWGAEDGGTYFVRQLGDTVWILGLVRNRDPIMREPAVQIPNPTMVFEGTLQPQSDGSAVITGDAVTVPKGLESGGDVTTATFTLDRNHKHFDLTSSSNGAFPFPSHYDKLYEPQEDTQAPSSTLTIGTPQFSPVAGSPPFVSGSTPFTITATDGDTGSGVQTLWYRVAPFVSGGTITAPFTPIVLDSPATDATGSFTIDGADGLYIVQTFATDASGNDENPKFVIVNLDKTPPSIVVNQPTASTYTHSDVITLDYSVDDGAGSGVQSFTATLDGSTANPSGGTLDSGQTIHLLDVALGTHTFAVTAKDNVLNTSTQSVVFTIIVTPESIEGDVNQFVANGKIKPSLANGLLAILTQAAAARARGDCSRADSLYSAFIKEVESQSGKGIDPTAAQIMIGDANYLIAHCP